MGHLWLRSDMQWYDRLFKYSASFGGGQAAASEERPEFGSIFTYLIALCFILWSSRLWVAGARVPNTY